jgi:prevent-host-death family protein
MAGPAIEQTVTATEARVHFGEIMRRVAVGRAPIVVEKDGIPTVVILAVAEYERLLRDARLGRFARASRAAGLDAEAQGLTEDGLAAEMDEIRARVHRERYG